MCNALMTKLRLDVFFVQMVCLITELIDGNRYVTS